MHFRILPRDVYKLKYNLYPLIPGYALLPMLRLTLSPGRSNEVSLDSLIREMIPSHIFVMVIFFFILDIIMERKLPNNIDVAVFSTITIRRMSILLETVIQNQDPDNMH